MQPLLGALSPPSTDYAYTKLCTPPCFPTADFFAPHKGLWSSLPILDQPRSFAAAVATPADIFVAGGGNGMDWYNAVVRYDRCTPCPALPRFALAPPTRPSALVPAHLPACRALRPGVLVGTP